MTGTLGLATMVPLAEHYLDRSPDVGTLLAFGAVTAGYGVLPDLDHPSATLARTLGPATRALAGAVSGLAGGHRKGTHTIWCAGLVVAGVAWLVAQFGSNAAILVVFCGFYLAAMILKLAPRPTSSTAELVYVVEAAAATAATWWLVGDWWWLPWAVGFGVVGHIAGDILTTEGVPILWPLPYPVVRIPLLGDTDSGRENLFASALGIAMVWIALASILAEPWWTTEWITDPTAWSLALGSHV